MKKREFETFTELQTKYNTNKLKFKCLLVVMTTLSRYLQPVPTQDNPNITSLTTQILSRNKGLACNYWVRNTIFLP